jgi:hypothetical protein
MKARTALVLLALVALVLVIWRPCRGPSRAEIGVTSALAGRWTTTDARYANRFLEIGPDEIVLGQGEEGEARHPLRAVLLESTENGPPVYVLRYELDQTTGVTADLRLIVEGGALRIENQGKMVWTRTP